MEEVMVEVVVEGVGVEVVGVAIVLRWSRGTMRDHGGSG